MPQKQPQEPPKDMPLTKRPPPPPPPPPRRWGYLAGVQAPHRCPECKFYFKAPGDPDEYRHRCLNPFVNQKNGRFLAGVDIGANAIFERDDSSWFAACGRKGKLFAEKEV